MPYIIERDGTTGKILGLGAWNNEARDLEFIKESDPEVIAFRGRDTENNEIEIAIILKQRQLAIQALKAEEKIDSDFEEPVIKDTRIVEAL